MQSQKQPLLASTAQAFSILFFLQNEKAIDLTKEKMVILIESGKVKIVCFLETLTLAHTFTG